MNPAGLLLVVRWEWFRLYRRLGFWAVAAIVLLFVIATLTASALAAAYDDDLSFALLDYPNIAAEVLEQLAPFVGVILSAFVFGSEFSWGTYRALTARGLPRWQPPAAKLLLLTAALVGLWAASILLSLLAGALAGQGETDLEAAGVFTDFGAVLLAALAYIGLGAALTVTGRSTAFGLGVAFGIVVFELIGYPLITLLAALIDLDLAPVFRWTLNGVTGRLINDNDGDLSRWLFLLPTLAYGVVLWAIALTGLSRRDLSSGSG